MSFSLVPSACLFPALTNLHCSHPESILLLLQDGKDSRWRVEPHQGIIPPKTEVSVAVIANLDDTTRFQDNVNLFVENSSTYVIPVRAVGIGTTIVTDKPFAPELNLGPHFR